MLGKYMNTRYKYKVGLNNALESLQRFQRVVILRDEQHLGFAAIAGQLGVTEGRAWQIYNDTRWRNYASLMPAYLTARMNSRDGKEPRKDVLCS